VKARLSRSAQEAIHGHGRKDYPSEACGALLGRPGTLEILEAHPCGNANTERAADRYLLNPTDQLRIEKDARARGLDVLGYYHSHPDHPSQASATDLAQSWEGLLYLILAVQQGEPKTLQGWFRQPGQEAFQEVTVDVI
jgi:proteasome lid subunit RPN8/RPN11